MTNHDLILACLLNPELVRERVDEWRDLVERATQRRVTPDGVELLLPSPEMAPSVIDLVLAEHECCPFFGFALRLDERGLSVEVTAPAVARVLIDELLGSGTPDGSEETPRIHHAAGFAGPPYVKSPAPGRIAPGRSSAALAALSRAHPACARRE